ncbi:phosphoenolpyruvate carboxykinase (GTP) [Candidatus Thorarchaeota archaeon]|nr:MAG: phosphoenolpyruvate carboxykinase (GTP) [Candidatus Thorarchaeota archaeon]
MEHPLEILKSQLDKESCSKIQRISHSGVHDFLAQAVQLCKPERVFVVTDSKDDIAAVRQGAIDCNEESRLKLDGHTIHFDGYYDQARDTENTRYLVPEDTHLDPNLNQIEREKGLKEVLGFLDGSMRGKEMIVRFFSLAPNDSDFSILTMQITDSYYVAHSLDLLYRPAYTQFTEMDAGEEFFRILHSAGRLEHSVSADVEKRRIFIDYTDDTVYSVNTQYAGNTVGLKKLAFRLAIRKADREGWLAEHMFIMAVHGPGGRKTYFSGAFPSACGKTSTSMVQGETIVGDDLAYIRKFDDGIRTANVESGIFGIIRGVNTEDDPVIFDVLTSPGEIIFTNVLIHDGTPYWLGDGREHPETGVNYAGKWHKGMEGPDGEEVPISHKNARYTLRISYLENRDSMAEAKEGVPLEGIIYGGRDADTWVPVTESCNWVHGVITMGASLESESTAATLGKEGVRKFQPFSNIDFVSIPLGRYVKNHLRFIDDVERPPKIFGVNYFLKDEEGNYLNGKQDKRVWLKWMDLRIHGEIEAIETPIGLIPRYADLKRLFREVLEKEYTQEQYQNQFQIRVPELLDKIERISTKYREDVEEVPQQLFDILDEQRERLLIAQQKHGDYINPRVFEVVSICCH